MNSKIYFIYSKIISDENNIDYILKRLKLIYNFNKETRTSIKFGLNSALQIMKNNKNTLNLIFIFYKKSLETLFNLILLKYKELENNKLYFINNDEIKNFNNLFNIKKLLAFTIIKNDKNEKVIEEIKNNLSNYNIFNNELIPIYSTNIKEITIEQ